MFFVLDEFSLRKDGSEEPFLLLYNDSGELTAHTVLRKRGTMKKRFASLLVGTVFIGWGNSTCVGGPQKPEVTVAAAVEHALSESKPAPAAPLSYPAHSFSQVVQQTMPSVVSITAISEREVLSPFGNDPFFGLFFGPQSFTSRSSGSGVIVDPRGYIVTCAHVVEHARSVKVTLASGRTLKAEVILVDEALDLAILHVDSKVPLPSVSLFKGVPFVGDPVAAIGNAFSVGLTVTHGIVSAGYRVFGGKVVIQTDAPINPGNSGGPILTLDGQLVGIASAIASKTGASHGVGFLIPSIAVRQMLGRAIDGAKVARVPAKVQTLEPSVVEALNERGAQIKGGCVVSTVWDKKSGITPGDVILRVAGQEVHNREMFEFFCQMVPVGESCAVTVIKATDLAKDDEVIPQTLLIKTQPQVSAAESAGATVLEGGHPLRGITVTDLSPDIAASLNWEGAPKGVIVLEGNNQFVKKGDVILQVNGYEIRTVADLQNVLSKKSKGFSINVRRGNAMLQQSIY